MSEQHQCEYYDGLTFCDRTFATRRGLYQHHVLTNHYMNYFRYSPVTVQEVRCDLCSFIPDQYVEKPKASYQQHMRRRHRIEYMMEKKPLVIEELP